MPPNCPFPQIDKPQLWVLLNDAARAILMSSGNHPGWRSRNDLGVETSAMNHRRLYA